MTKKDWEDKNLDKCIKCGRNLKWGEFAYNQEMCWECFDDEVNRIIDNISLCERHGLLMWSYIDEHIKIITHMRDVMSEVHREGRFKR